MSQNYPNQIAFPIDHNRHHGYPQVDNRPCLPSPDSGNIVSMWVDPNPIDRHELMSYRLRRELSEYDEDEALLDYFFVDREFVIACYFALDNNTGIWSTDSDAFVYADDESTQLVFTTPMLTMHLCPTDTFFSTGESLLTMESFDSVVMTSGLIPILRLIRQLCLNGIAQQRSVFELEQKPITIECSILPY